MLVLFHFYTASILEILKKWNILPSDLKLRIFYKVKFSSSTLPTSKPFLTMTKIMKDTVVLLLVQMSLAWYFINSFRECHNMSIWGVIRAKLLGALWDQLWVTVWWKVLKAWNDTLKGLKKILRCRSCIPNLLNGEACVPSDLGTD